MPRVSYQKVLAEEHYEHQFRQVGNVLQMLPDMSPPFMVEREGVSQGVPRFSLEF